MKKFIVFLTAFTHSLLCMAQTEKEINSLIKEYSSLMIQGQYSMSTEYIYPKLFEIIPKETMIEAIESAFSDTSTFKMGFSSMEVQSVSESYEEKEISYAFVDYSMTMVMLFINPETTEEEIFQMAGVFNDMYGSENFKFESRKFTITTFNKMAVIKEKSTKKLFILEINDQLTQVLQMFMSPEFIERAF